MREVLESSLRLFGRSLLPCLPLAAFATVIGQLPSGVDLARGTADVGLAAKPPEWWLLYVLGTLCALVVWGAILYRQRAVAEGVRTSVASELAASARRLPAMLLYLALTLVILLAGLIPAVVLIWLLRLEGMAAYALAGATAFAIAGLLSFAWPALLIDRHGAKAAVDASFAMVRRHWRRLFSLVAMLLATLIIGFAVAGVAIAILGAVAERAGQAFAAVFVALATVVLAAIVVLFLSALLVVAYDDLSRRDQLSAPSSPA
jgi:membrane-anchored glycerophosphoryl diester phosphodiesterase (GDPDase)